MTIYDELVTNIHQFVKVYMLYGIIMTSYFTNIVVYIINLQQAHLCVECHSLAASISSMMMTRVCM